MLVPSAQACCTTRGKKSIVGGGGISTSQFVGLAQAAEWQNINAPSLQGDSISMMPAFILKLTSGNMVPGELVSP